MNYSALSKLSIETLQGLQVKVKEELERRMDFRILIGRTGHFVSGKSNQKILVTIEKVDIKTVLVKENFDSPNPGKLWRVYKQSLIMDGVVRERPIKPCRPANSTSATEYNVTSW